MQLIMCDIHIIKHKTLIPYYLHFRSATFFHNKQLYNSQPDRRHSLAYIFYDMLLTAREKIGRFKDLEPVMIDQANSKLKSREYIEN